MTEHDPTYLNLGRACARLNLEDRLEARKIPASIAQRLAMVKGFLQGLIEKHDWERALKLIYGKGVVATLFDGDYSTITQSIISELPKVKRPQRERLEDSTRKALQTWEPQDQYQLALLCAIPVDDARNIFSSIEKHLNPEQQKNANTSLAQRYVEQEQYSAAYTYFCKALHTQGIEDLFATLLSRPLKDNIKLLIQIAEREEFDIQIAEREAPDARNKKIAAVVEHLIQAPESSEFQKPCFSEIEALYETIKKYTIPLPPESSKALINLVANSIGTYGVNKSNDPILKEAYARSHIQTEPCTAYLLFRELNITTPQRVEAARNALTAHAQDYSKGLDPSGMDNEDVQAVYASINTWNKQSISLSHMLAGFLHDQEGLQGISRYYLKEAHQQNIQLNTRQHLLKKAYQAWIEGDGEQAAPYIYQIREEIIAMELQGDYPTFYWVDHHDLMGRVQAFTAALPTHPHRSYQLISEVPADAIEARDREPYLQQARQRLVTDDPEQSLLFFQRGKDDAGITLAIHAIAQKYGIPMKLLSLWINPIQEQQAAA